MRSNQVKHCVYAERIQLCKGSDVPAPRFAHTAVLAQKMNHNLSSCLCNNNCSSGNNSNNYNNNAAAASKKTSNNTACTSSSCSRMLLFGGYSNNLNNFENDFFEYQVASKKWVKLEDTDLNKSPQPRANHTAVLRYTRDPFTMRELEPWKLVIFGGMDRYLLKSA